MQQVGLLPTSHSQQHELNKGPDSVSYLVCFTILSKASRHISSVCKSFPLAQTKTIAPIYPPPVLVVRDVTGLLLHFGPFQTQQMLQHNPNCPEAKIPVFQDLGMLTNLTIILQVKSPEKLKHSITAVWIKKNPQQLFMQYYCMVQTGLLRLTFTQHHLSPLAVFSLPMHTFFTMEGGGSGFTKFTVPTLRYFWRSVVRVSGNKQELVACAIGCSKMHFFHAFTIFWSAGKQCKDTVFPSSVTSPCNSCKHNSSGICTALQF